MNENDAFRVACLVMVGCTTVKFVQQLELAHILPVHMSIITMVVGDMKASEMETLESHSHSQ